MYERNEMEEWAKRVTVARREVYAAMGVGPHDAAVPANELADEADRRGMWAHAVLPREYWKHNH